MQESSWRKSAAIFVVVVVCLAAVLFGGVYFLKQRSTNDSNHKTPEVTKSKDGSKKTNKKPKTSSKHKQTSTSGSKQTSSGSNSDQSTSQPPQEVAPAGLSDTWYLPVLGMVALGLGGYEYYLSRQTLRQTTTNR